ncbi:hypothetical protein KLP40_15300 [Hymenobacter sp. NST-14]|uniref:hypothetical protein n=1 Tax=Hymenobacter piscis TaxID=2839984 RepID=UPI001C00ACAA|nr:hypothetical protein [Hymenobacter piscis]MBT9394536.1 hypothetical protein [Hymenobacter piscis]
MIRLVLLLLLVLVTSGVQAQTGPMAALLALDAAYALHGIRFGTPEGTIVGLLPQFSGVGKRWQSSHVYSLTADTATIGRQPVKPELWFRGQRFVGATYMLTKQEQKTRLIRQELERHYGPPRPGNVPGAFYWLGQRTYILYEDALPGVAVHIASLDMLNEQVIETSVRQDARASLGWQPDSLGLPRQFPLPSEKKPIK